MRTPLNVVDQLILHLDQASEPWSVHCEVRVPGRLDEGQVAAAALQATRRHPIARARLASFRPYDRRLFWDIADRVDCVPLAVVDYPNDEALCQARSQLLSRRVQLDAAPPFALTLAHGPDGDSLILNLNHVAGDGISGYRLMTSIARAYAKADDPTPDLDPLVVRELRDHIVGRTPKDGFRRRRSREDRELESQSERSARVVVHGGQPGAVGFGFHLLRLERLEAAELKARRRPPATINDLLIASLAVAIRRFNGDRDIAPAPIAVWMPLNLRPPEWSQEIVSNIVSSASVPILAGEQSDLTTAQLAVADRTQTLKQRRQDGGMIDPPVGAGIWPVGILRLATRMLSRPIAGRVAVVLSNLGLLPAPVDFGGRAGAATQLWFSPPGEIAIGVATMNDEICLTIRYCRKQFSALGASAFAETWRQVLLSE